MKSILVIEDELISRNGLVEEFKENGWLVREAESAEKALTTLKSYRDIDIIILDMRLPEKDGYYLLEILKKESIAVPKVFIISAYVNRNEWRRLLDLGVRGIFPKPIDPGLVAEVLTSFQEGDETSFIRPPSSRPGEDIILEIFECNGKRVYIFSRSSDKSTDKFPDIRKISKEQVLSEETEKRINALITYFRTTAKRDISFKIEEPLLIVARRWNSWYPSFFNVDGGAYAILGPTPQHGHAIGALIDPGFKSLGILNELGIPILALTNCLVTHNHPDHVGGIFEYLTARHVIEEDTIVYSTRPVLDMLTPFSNLKFAPQEFNSQPVELIQPYVTMTSKTIRVCAFPIETSHQNIGILEGTRGILLSYEYKNVSGTYITSSTSLLLGDTEYKTSIYSTNVETFEKIRKAFSRPDLRLVVLHIGCSQLKDGIGKHLYLDGTIEIIRDIDAYRRKNIPDPTSNKLLVLISEWGLEHATRQQVSESLPLKNDLVFNNAVFNKSLVAKTIELIRSYKFDTLTILPADVGLTIGLLSGSIYRSETKVNPEDIKFRSTKYGLEYSP